MLHKVDQDHLSTRRSFVFGLASAAFNLILDNTIGNTIEEVTQPVTIIGVPTIYGTNLRLLQSQVAIRFGLNRNLVTSNPSPEITDQVRSIIEIQDVANMGPPVVQNPRARDTMISRLAMGGVDPTEFIKGVYKPILDVREVPNMPSCVAPSVGRFSTAIPRERFVGSVVDLRCPPSEVLDSKRNIINLPNYEGKAVIVDVKVGGPNHHFFGDLPQPTINRFYDQQILANVKPPWFVTPNGIPVHRLPELHMTMNFEQFR